MAKRYSKLEKDIEKLFVPELKLKVRCFAFDIGNYGTKFPRYYIQQNHEIIWDFPKYYVELPLCMYLVSDDVKFNQLMRNYINTGIDNLLDFKPEQNEVQAEGKEHWAVSLRVTNNAHTDFVEILKSADRRIGKQKLSEYFKNTEIKTVKTILQKRGIEI